MRQYDQAWLGAKRGLDSPAHKPKFISRRGPAMSFAAEFITARTLTLCQRPHFDPTSRLRRGTQRPHRVSRKCGEAVPATYSRCYQQYGTECFREHAVNGAIQ